jgi:hypothetical protein
MKLKLLFIRKSPRPDKKFVAKFIKNGKPITTHFGAKGYSDFTMHGDPKRKQKYLRRHRPAEDWSDPTSAGTLSRYILWNKKSFSESLRAYKRKFKL